MAPKIFLTGATGYIGGDVLDSLHAAHPDYEYSLLVRSVERAKAVQKAYPKVRLVEGDLDNSKVIQAEAARADIVIHTADASDNEPAAHAIAAGLAEGHTAEKPGYWLHTGGSGILTYADSSADKLGEWDDKEYNDWSGVGELTSLPDEAFHRNVDKIVLEAGTKKGDVVRTALLCPPTIYGKGRGQVSSRSRQVPSLTNLILKKGFVPVLGPGKARWNHIHVADLSALFVALLDAAVAGKNDKGLWGAEGHYLVEAGEHLWLDLSKHIADVAEKDGYIEKAENKSLNKDEAMDVAGFEAVSWGFNSRGKAERAKKLLGWEPKGESLNDSIPALVKSEHARLE